MYNITVESKDKRIQEIVDAPDATSVKGLQPKIVIKIKIRLAVLQASTTITQFARFDPNWRVHEWKGRPGYWSCDVTGNTRLLFDFDHTKMLAYNMIYDDPH